MKNLSLREWKLRNPQNSAKTLSTQKISLFFKLPTYLDQNWRWLLRVSIRGIVWVTQRYDISALTKLIGIGKYFRTVELSGIVSITVAMAFYNLLYRRLGAVIHTSIAWKPVRLRRSRQYLTHVSSQLLSRWIGKMGRLHHCRSRRACTRAHPI